MQSTYLKSGLTSSEAKKRLYQYGENKLVSDKKISALKIFCGQFKDLMTLILIISTLVSFILGEIVEAGAIIIIVILNALMGFIQEYRTERTLEMLKDIAAPTATVIRDKKTAVIPASSIVPGDVLILHTGDKIPADGMILEATSLECNESLLSGESLPAEKILYSDDEVFSEPIRPDYIYNGTIITKGRGKAVVTSTGMQTEMGKIAGLLSDIEDEETPLQKKLAQLGWYIAVGCLAICFVVAVTGVLRGYPVFDMLVMGISLAVAAVPEGLPAIVTISLALAVNRILNRNALVRRLHAVETLGCANVICTDKTGTLTENKMTVKEIFTNDFSAEVTGIGYQGEGDFLVENKKIHTENSRVLTRIFEIASVCNTSEITGKDKNNALNVNGDPTEIALMVMAHKAGMDTSRGDYTNIDEIPFDSERKMMTVYTKDKAGKTFGFTKGAPDFLLKKCRYILTENGTAELTPAVLAKVNRANEVLAGKAMRVLGLAYKESPSSLDDCESNMVFVGLAAMIDPPRAEVYDAVKVCGEAKIRTVMITGDHKATACAIAKDIGILKAGDLVMTGAEIESMSDSEFEKRVQRVSVFARVSPNHKLKIVRALKKRGDTVAMTGDGVNDAPAVKEADIGVSMGISGTDVTKSAASIILLDDNFATLVATIEEGRIVYSNIRKFIRYLFSCNIGEVVTMFFGMIMGLPIVLLPIHILLVNLATDGLPALALSLERSDDEIMTKPPRPAGESVFSNGLAGTIVFRGFIIGFSTLMIFTLFYGWYGDLTIARTGALFTLVMTQLFHVFECKSETKSLLSINPFENRALIASVLVSVLLMLLVMYNPVMQKVFSTVGLTLEQVIRVILISLMAPLLSSLIMLIPKRSKPDVVVTDAA